MTLDLIKQGKVTATLGVYPRFMGMTVVKQMRQVLRGDPVPYILETPSFVVDIHNVAAYQSESMWTEPVEGKPEEDNDKPTVPQLTITPRAFVRVPGFHGNSSGL